MKKCLTLLTITILVTIALSQTTKATSLSLTVTTNKPTYTVGEFPQILGNLTLNNEPVQDGIVALQVNNSKNELYLVRTLTTGTIPQNHWTLELTQFITCDSAGNPETTFPRGGAMGFKITIKNNAATTYDYMVVISLLYGNTIPYKTFIATTGTLDGQKTRTITLWPITIPNDSPIGNATAYASLLNALPTDNGLPYCPEKEAVFQITAASGNPAPLITPTVQNGTFNVTTYIASGKAWKGNYTIYAITKYQYYIATAQNTYEVKLIGDFNQDNIIDISDLSAVAIRFGKSEGDPGYDPIYDLDHDGAILISDISMVARGFGASLLDP